MRRKLKIELIVALVYTTIAIVLCAFGHWGGGLGFFVGSEIATLCWRRYRK